MRWEKTLAQVPDTDCDGLPMTVEVALVHIGAALRAAGHDEVAVLREYADAVERMDRTKLEELAEKMRAFRAGLAELHELLDDVDPGELLGVDDDVG